VPILLIIFKILLYLLFFIIGLILLLLLIPFGYSGQVLTADGFKAKLVMSWAWKLLGINVEIEGGDVKTSFCILNKKIYKLKSTGAGKKKEQIKKQPDKKGKEKKGGKGFSIKDITDRAVLNEFMEYLIKVLNIAKPKYFYLNGTYGFDDPSLTGIVYGVLETINSIIPGARLSLAPDFTREEIDIDLRAGGSVIMGSLIYQTVRTVLKKPVRKILFRKKE